jgi:hypothetical protein
MVAFLRLIVNHCFTSFIDEIDSPCLNTLTGIVTRKIDVNLLILGIHERYG